MPTLWFVRSSRFSSALLLLALSARAQPAPSAPEADPATPEVSPDDVPVRLSPFEVSTERDRGYFASSSLSGTRLNSNLKDLAAPITVITKAQLIDTAALDVNDVFLYEASTEGLHQYTEYVQDRSFYNEVTTLAPQSANRIRGIGRSNPARNNFAASSSVPIDSYNIGSIEINRGPNANIFGLGEAAGTVNTNIARADPGREVTQLMFRGDSYGGWRAQADFNRPIVPDRAAFRLAFVHEDKGFERTPASEVINRFTGTFHVKPTPHTRLHATYESYNNAYNRANTTLPRDAYSEWMASGMPVWNPTVGANGGWRPYGSTGAYTQVTVANEPTQLPLGLFPNVNGFWQVPSAYVVDGVIERYEMNRNNTTNAPGAAGPYRYMETGSIYRRGGNFTPPGGAAIPPLILFQAPSIADRAAYDYESINFLAPNYGQDSADLFEFVAEHDFLQTDRHYLGLQLGAYLEDIAVFDHAFLSKTDGATPYVAIDVNETFLDGTANPYFLRPYIGASAPRISWNSERNEHYRANLAYQLDLSREEGWKQWLGRHSFLGYGEERASLTKNLGGGDRNVTDYTWTSANDRLSLPLRGNTYRLYPRYYVGGPVTEAGPIIDYAPQAIQNLSGSRPFIWYGPNRAQTIEEGELEGLITGGSSRKREITSVGAVWQGFFLNDRVVPTIGYRKDTQREIASRNLNANPLQPTTTINPATRRHDLSWVEVYPGPWIENSGTTRTAGIVVSPLSWLSLHYNKADSFKPEPVRYSIDLELVPNPTGDSEDYGIRVELFRGKVIAKLNRYETVEQDSRSGATSGAFAARSFRFFFDADTELTFDPNTNLFQSSDDPWDLEQIGAQWYLWANPAATPAQAVAYSRSTYLAPFGFDDAFITRVREIGLGGFAETNTVTSRGYELELNFNPNDHWTLKLTGAQQEAIDSELSNRLGTFFATNLEAMKAIVIPSNPQTIANGTAGRQWWTSGATSPTSTATPQNFYFANILTTLRQASANEGKPRPQTREYRFAVTTNYRLAGLTDGWLKNLSIGGAVRWEDKAALGYYGLPSTDPDTKGAIVEYDVSRPIYDEARTYVDLMASYQMRLFDDHVRCRLQLNVRNAFEGGRLQPFVYNPDGTPWNYRIIDPRQFIFSATFDF